MYDELIQGYSMVEITDWAGGQNGCAGGIAAMPPPIKPK